MHDLLPDGRIVVFDLRHLAQHAGAVHETVETAEVLLDLLGQRQVDATLGLQEIHGYEYRLDAAGSLDVVCQCLQFLAAAPLRNDERAFLCALNSQCAANAITGARDQNDAVRQCPLRCFKLARRCWVQ